MILIKTYEELDSWLEHYHYFEDGHVLKINLKPFFITVGILIEGTYEANTEKKILNFDIIPKNVSSYEYTPDFEPSDNHYIESIEPIEVNEGVGLQIPGLPFLTLLAETFTISENKIISSTFKPWTRITTLTALKN